MKMTDIQCTAFLWALLIIQTGSVCSDVQFLEKLEGESVVLPCAVEQRNHSPYGVYLKYDWLKPVEILYMHTKSEFVTNTSDDKKRISVHGDPSYRFLNVTFSQLRVADTGRYYCEFIVDIPNSEDGRIPGKTEFFLLVRAGEWCSCSSYSSLLYSLFSSVAVLTLLVLVGVVMIYQGKARNRAKSQPQAPIYEEMTGVQRPRGKLAPSHQEEMESSEYRNCLVTKSCPENYYERPSGALCPRTEPK